jgi:hypothetical protein
MTDAIIEMMRREDAKIEDMIDFVTPVSRGGNEYGPMIYSDKKEPSAWEKQTYSQILTGREAQPIVEVTQEDVNILKNKAYRATEKDFNDYVGNLLRPDENPANKAFLHKIYPEWFSQQKKAIETWHDTQKRIQSLLIVGPKNEEDLFLLYRLGYGSADPAEAKQLGKKTTNVGYNKQLLDSLDVSKRPQVRYSSGASDAEFISDKRMNDFQRGVFNTNKRKLELTALAGTDQSLFKKIDSITTTYGNYPPTSIPANLFVPH